MMRMNAEKIGDDVIEVARWREASCGVVSLHDNDGNRLLSRYIGRLPEGKKQSLKEQLRQEVMYILGQNPDLKLAVCGDGEKGNWTFSESLNPDVEVLDFWHAAEGLCILFSRYQHFVGQGLLATTLCKNIVPAEQNA